MRARAFAGAGFLLLPALPVLSAQDTASAPVLPDVVVTAELNPVALARATSTVTVLRREDLRKIPAKNLADALRLVPGLSFVDFGGMDSDPQAIVRGFYGGGEVDYVLVLLDGERINTPGSGRVNWELIPLESVESVEVLRGPASPLYGDAALGAVISIRTAQTSGPASWSVAAGEHGVARLSGRVATGRVARSLAGFADLNRQDGFRNHSRRRSGAVGATGLATTGERSMSLSLVAHRRAFDEPGPLPESALDSAEMSSPFFRFDETDESFLRASARVSGLLGRFARASTSLSFDDLGKDATRTVPLAADYADTKRRLLDETRLSSSTQLDAERSLLGRHGRLVAGVELGRGTATSTYFDHTTGDEADYRAAPGEPAPTGDGSSARRVTAAAFAQYELDVSSRLRFVLGARGDRVRDEFDATTDAEARTARHSAFSPRAALNFGYAASRRHRGHAHVSAGRSFKAPTLDQLFDRRTVPVPFPPFAITFSNPELEPQHATSLEAGVRHWLLPAAGTVIELSAVAYSVKMVDELDFDVQQLRYVNLGRSRHDGIETGIQASRADIGSLFITYSLQDATSRFGDNEGKRLKAIPRTNVRAGVVREAGAGSVSLVVTSVGRAFLDDANTRRIPGYTTFDAKLAYRIRGVNVWAAGFNLLDRRYSTTGFADPGGSDVSFFYPAAGRLVQIGVSSAR